MIKPILMAICAIVSALWCFYLGLDESGETLTARPRQLVGLIPFAASLVIAAVVFVPTGHTGIVTTFGRVEPQTIQAGVHFVAPWQRVIKMDNRVQKEVLETQAFSSDIQQVDVCITVNHSIDKATAQDLYASVGKGYVDIILTPRALEGIKTVFSGYSAEELITHRIELGEQISQVVAADVSPYGIQVSGVSIEDLDFTDAYTDAVEAKQVATQNKLTAETEQAQLTLEAEAEANRKIISAQAEADANKVIAASITPELIQLMEAQARIEHGWVTVQGAGTVVTRQ